MPGPGLAATATQASPQIYIEALGGVSLPGSVTVQSVTSSLACISGGYRIDPAPVATVSATIAMPFSGIFTLNGGSRGTITTTISDSARVFGS